MNVAHNIHRLILLIVLCCMGTNNAFAANKYLVTNDLQCDTTTVVIPEKEDTAETSMPTEFEFQCTVGHPTTNKRLSFDIKGIALPFSEPPKDPLIASHVTGQCDFATHSGEYAKIETPKTRTLRENIHDNTSGANRYTDLYGKRCCLCKTYKPAPSNLWIQAGKYTTDLHCNTNNPGTCSFSSRQFCVEQCQKAIIRLIRDQVYVEVP